MPRRRLFVTKEMPYHLTSRSNNKEWFYLPLCEVWEVFRKQLIERSGSDSLLVHAFVLMSNHFHLVGTCAQFNVGEVMRNLLTGVSKEIQRRADRINHVFGARYKWSVLDSSYGVAYAYKYVARNPVRAGLVPSTESYSFSSFTEDRAIGQPALSDGIGPLWSVVPQDWEMRRAWLNQPAPKELEVLIRNGLRNEKFAFSKGNDVRRKLEQLRSVYGVEKVT